MSEEHKSILDQIKEVVGVDPGTDDLFVLDQNLNPIPLPIFNSTENSTQTEFEEWLWDVAKQVSIKLYKEYGRVVYVTTYVWAGPETHLGQGFLRFYHPPTSKQLNMSLLETSYSQMRNSSGTGYYINMVVQQLLSHLGVSDER